jgi:hypothetical protein
MAYATAVPSQKDLKIELQRTNRIRQLKLTQHTRMQDTKDANSVVLAAKVKLDSRSVAREESRICEYVC